MLSEEELLNWISPSIRLDGESPTRVITGGLANLRECHNDVRWATYVAQRRSDGNRDYEENGRVLFITTSSQSADEVMQVWAQGQRFEDMANILPVVEEGRSFSKWVRSFPGFDNVLENATETENVASFLDASRDSHIKSLVVCTIDTLPIIGSALEESHTEFDVIAIFNDLPHTGEVTSVPRISVIDGLVSFPEDIPERTPLELNDEDNRFIRAVQRYTAAGKNPHSYRLFSRAESRYMNRSETVLATMCKEGPLTFNGHVIDLLSRSVRQGAPVLLSPRLGVEFVPGSAAILRYPEQ